MELPHIEPITPVPIESLKSSRPGLPTAAGSPSASSLDCALTAQFAVAWAGEGGEPRRLGWWRSDFVSPYGGLDLFRRLLPNTAEWAVLQAAREAARRKDAEFRAQDHDPDRLLSLFTLGFEVDERVEERLQELKRSGRSPQEALAPLKNVVEPSWNRERFLDWIRTQAQADTAQTPTGRRLVGDPPETLDAIVTRLLGALAPLGERYPLPHYFRKSA